MDQTVSLMFEKTRFLWGESTPVTIQLENRGAEPLAYLNYSNHDAMPTLIVKSVETGVETEHKRLEVPGAMPPPVTVEPKTTWEYRFDLNKEIEFPSAGEFNVYARCDWGRSEKAQSDPVRVEVMPTSPQAFDTATTGGGPVGDLFCAWVNLEEEEESDSLWLSLISTSGEARILQSLPICEIPKEARPVLSVPPNAPPTSQYVAWIEDQILNHIVHTYGRLEIGGVGLNAPGYEIVPPLFEDPFEPGAKQGAEALLIREVEGGWLLCAVDLDGGVITARDSSSGGGGGVGSSSPPNDLFVKGPMPLQNYTAYRSDASRRTVFSQQNNLSADRASVSLSVAGWAKGSLPQTPKLLAEWEGVLVAADQCLTATDALVGAALLYVPPAAAAAADSHFYELRRWRLEADDTFIETGNLPLFWKPGTAIEKAVLRIRQDEKMFALLKNTEDNLWRLFDGEELKLLADSLQNIAEPIKIFFVDQSVPCILFPDAESGLRLAYLGAPPRHIPLV